jgi:hypothetical protein
MSEPYSVVSPGGRRRIAEVPANPPPGEGERTVGFLWDNVFRGDEMEPIFRDALRGTRPELRFVGHEVFGNIHDADVIDALAARLAEHRVDAVVASVGACGSCTPAVVRACATVERLGIRTVAVVGDGFGPTARAISQSMGIGHLPLVSYPGPGLIMADGAEVFESKVRSMATELVDALLSREGPSGREDVAGPDEYSRHEIVCTGSLEDVQEHFLRSAWTDGLPVIPPTPDRVARFLARTRRDADEVIGVLEPDQTEATVWNVAVNAVMAGCRPEYFPTLLAVAECLCEPAYLLGDFGCTPGIEPLVVVSGPIVDELDFNSGAGVMRVGRQANTSIGRFVRLFMTNVAGLRIAPSRDKLPDVSDRPTDNGAVAQSPHVVMAEDGGSVERLGWTSFGEDRGFGTGESIVSVTSVITQTGPIYSGGDTAEPHLAAIAEASSRALASWPVQGALYLQKEMDWNPPLLLLGSGVAQRLAEDGLGKDDLRRYLGEHCRVAVRQVELDIWNFSKIHSPVNDAVANGWLPVEYGASTDAERLVPQIIDPERIGIVVGAHPGRNQSKLYVSHSVFGQIVSRRVG